jgi:hypothetical protein
MKKTTNIEDSTTFPHTQFPFKIVHMEGKDMMDKKICYFQSQDHADKYITKSKFKSRDYQLYIKPGTDVTSTSHPIKKKTRKSTK